MRKKQREESRDVGYWLGWHAGGVRKALGLLEATDADGRPVHPRESAIQALRLVWEKFMKGGNGFSEEFANDDMQMWAGFAVEADTGEVQALRDTYPGAVAAVDQAETYWDEAAACGHPSAPGYVAQMYPFRIRQVTKQEWNDILDTGTPVLDREP